MYTSINPNTVEEAISKFGIQVLHGTISHRVRNKFKGKIFDHFLEKTPLLWKDKIRYCLDHHPELVAQPMPNYYKGWIWSPVGLTVVRGNIKASGGSKIVSRNKRESEHPNVPYLDKWEDMLRNNNWYGPEIVVSNPLFGAIYFCEDAKSRWDSINSYLTLEKVISFSRTVGMPVHQFNLPYTQ